MPRVCVVDDAIPFVGQGRNVMHGYITGADPHLIPASHALLSTRKESWLLTVRR